MQSFANRALEGPYLAYAFVAEPAEQEVDEARLLGRIRFGEVFKSLLIEGHRKAGVPGSIHRYRRSLHRRRVHRSVDPTDRTPGASATDGRNWSRASWRSVYEPSVQRFPEVMRQFTHVLSIRTTRRGLVDFTREVRAWVAAQRVTTGLLTVFCKHTSASLLIQENAAREVRTDLEAFFEQIAPEDPSALCPRRRRAGRHAGASAHRC